MVEADTVPMIIHFMKVCNLFNYCYTVLIYIYISKKLFENQIANRLYWISRAIVYNFKLYIANFLNHFKNLFRCNVFSFSLYILVKNNNIDVNACFACRNFVCYNGFTI